MLHAQLEALDSAEDDQSGTLPRVHWYVDLEH
jgi:hypothetical protein